MLLLVGDTNAVSAVAACRIELCRDACPFPIVEMPVPGLSGPIWSTGFAPPVPFAIGDRLNLPADARIYLIQRGEREQPYPLLEKAGLLHDPRAAGQFFTGPLGPPFATCLNRHMRLSPAGVVPVALAAGAGPCAGPLPISGRRPRRSQPENRPEHPVQRLLQQPEA